MFKQLMSCLVLSGVLCAAPCFAADTYPSKPIQLIVHGNAGAGMDIFCRALSKSLETILPQPVVVENRPGGGSAVATTYVATNKNYGYVWLAVTNTHVITPLVAKTPFSLKDLKPVAQLVTDPTVLVTSADSPWKTFQELMDDVKKNPGNISSSIAFIGSLDHYLLMELKERGYELKPLPFESGSEAVVSIVGGHTQVGFSEPSEVESQIRAGKLRALATFSSQRLSSFPDVPTISELGYDIAISKFRGIMVHKDTPDDVVKAIEGALQQAMQTQVLQEYMKASCMEPSYKNAEDFSVYLNENIDGMSEFLESIGKLKK